MFSILDTTTRVYTKVWEMCGLAGFLTGREVARRMISRKSGTMIFTIATAALQEVDKQLQAEKAKIAQLQEQMKDSGSEF